MNNYVVGFVFHDQERSKVLVVEKLKPAFMAGKLNGIGGEINTGEEAIQTMCREAEEETGYAGKPPIRGRNIAPDLWTEFARIRRPRANMHFFQTVCPSLANHADGRKNDIGEQMSIVEWEDSDVAARFFGDVEALLRIALLNPQQPVDIYLEDIGR